MFADHSRMFSVGLAVLIAVVLSVPVGLSSAAGSPEPWQSQESVLRIGSMQRVDSLNPLLGLNEISYVFYSLVYDGLQGVGQDLSATPNLATESWIVPESDPQMVLSGEPYGSVWQYNLSTNARWTDGEPFTADDVCWNINLHAQNYGMIWAYQPYAFFMSHAEKVDDSTVRIHFYDRSTGDPMPVAYGSQLQIPMLPKHELDWMEPSQLSFSWNGTPVIGTGPFMAPADILSEWIGGDTLTLLRNPDYHGLYDYGQLVHFDKLQLQFFDEPTQLVLALQTSAIDLAILPPAVYLDVESQIGSGALQNVYTSDSLRPDNYFVHVMTNMNNAGHNPSRLDPTVRHALAMATNKSYIVDQFYYGLGEEGSTLISPVNEAWHWEPAPISEFLPEVEVDDFTPGLAAEEVPLSEPAPGFRFEYNKTAAAELLEGAGYIDTNEDGIRECTASCEAVQLGLVTEGTPLSYDMYVRQGHPEENDIVQFLKWDWDQIGIQLNYMIVDEPTLVLRVYSYEYDMAMWDWSADPDPNYMLFTQTQNAWGGWSDTLYYSPAYEENYSASVSELDPFVRQDMVDNCQLVHYFDCPYIILSYPNLTVAWRTDTFTGWGDWSANPGRSVFNMWGGNQLYFDLLPLGTGNTPPSIENLIVNPNPAEPAETVSFEVSAYDLDNDSLVVTIEFGDGELAVETTAGGTPAIQTVTFYHAYASPGLYSIRVWANDSYGPATNNDTVYYENRVVVCSEGELSAHITPSPVVVDAANSIFLTAGIDFPYASESEFSSVTYMWSVVPSDLGTFDYRARKTANFTAGAVGASGEITCALHYYEVNLLALADLTIVPPGLSCVYVMPSVSIMTPMTSRNFTAQAYDSLGSPMPGLEYSWSVEGMMPGEYALNSTVGEIVTFMPLVEGIAWLNATTTDGIVTRTGTATVTSSYTVPQRAVDYRWYDMFNVSFGDWWYMRAEAYNNDVPLTDSYPYLYRWSGPPFGNTWTYSSMMLDITARNVSEISMVENPEFLPMHGPGNGGNAVIDWYLQYLTSEEMERFPNATAGWCDGWVVSLNGTTTLDEAAALTVLLGLTTDDFDDFSTWWSLHKTDIKEDFINWFKYEAGKDRLDIYPMYDYPFTTLYWDMEAVKVGEEIVLHYDLVSWGMEALVARWLHEAFVPTEWWFEGMDFQASIGPVMADLDISTAVAYAVYAWMPTTEPIEPCWVWEAMLGDSIETYPPESKESDFNPYADEQYLCRSPGNAYYNYMLPYDHTPGAWNLSEGETLAFEWPAGDQMFKVHVGACETLSLTDEMVVEYVEPMESDNPALTPGSVSVDPVLRTLTYTGPIDMWEWSRSQDEACHSYLADEWDRLGLLPWGVPYIEFSPASSGPTVLLDMSDVPLNPILDNPVNITITAYGLTGMLYEDYRGTVTFSSDRLDVTLPADYTFKAGDAGTYTFVSELTFHGTGWYLITCSDVSNESVMMAQMMVNVLSDERVLDHFELELSPPADVLIAGVETSVTVTAYDQFGTVFDLYNGSVSFSTDATGVNYTLPANYFFPVSDAGVATLPGLMYEEPGTYELVVFDTVDPLALGSLMIEVVEAPQIDYRLYDMFEQPWGEWWYWRNQTVYNSEIILNSSPGEYTAVYNPDRRNIQGTIIAPYRWNVSATDMPTVSVYDPGIMPVFGPDVEGASAHVDVYFEYLNYEWWNNYWVPVWSSDDEWCPQIEANMDLMPYDGYILGTIYTTTMNREAAETWMNMSVFADPMTWWADHSDEYRDLWTEWIEDQGNEEFDIYAGYEWPYFDLGTMTKLSVVDDDVVLTIAHMNYGYEVLITRWMTDRAICSHEPYMEDFQLSAQFESSFGDVTYDAVAQWGLRAVKANETESAAAWAWEPQNIDYIEYPGSDFNEYAYLDYTSWYSGDEEFGNSIRYDFTPTYFNLESYMTLTFQLPTDNNAIGYRGIQLPNGTIRDLRWYNNTMPYEMISHYGPMWLGWHGYPEVPGAPDISSMYDNGTKVLSLQGPLDFEDYHHAMDELYHSAPWIEFNVANYTWPGSGDDMPPIADAGEDRTVLGGEPVMFDGSGSYDDFGITNWTWRFLYDGHMEEIYGPNPEFTFWIEGEYSVVLVVTDTIGQTGMDSMTVTVSGFIPEFGSVAFTVIASVVVIALILAKVRMGHRREDE
jgi:peptide/nickel transport system substrate-binding protein